MSIENVKAFFEKVKADQGLQDKLKALADKRKAQEDATIAELIEIASESGHAFTADHLRAHHQAQLGELTDAELKTIAGGAYCTSVNTQITDSVTQ
jgi:predicted ribosomally synthesized peptide with nif11-like leader